MAKKTNKNVSKEDKPADRINEAWISMRTGIIVMAVVSIGMGGLTAWSAIQTQGAVKGILWGLGFGAAVWVVFVIALLFNRVLRGK